jgi:hypothetical protein
MALPPCLRLADLRDLTDDELRAHIIAQYIDPADEPWSDGNDGYVPGAQPVVCTTADIGTILVAYESVGDYGCDSSSYFLIERDGQLFEVHGGHCSCNGFEGQWEPKPVTPAYLVSPQWSMPRGGYDDQGEQHQDVVVEWLLRKYGGAEWNATPYEVPAIAIPTWALHVDDNGEAHDLRTVDSSQLLAAVQREAKRRDRAALANAVEQCRARGLLPTVQDLHVAADLASWRGHIDPKTGEPTPQARTLVDLWVGFGKHTVN